MDGVGLVSDGKKYNSFIQNKPLGAHFSEGGCWSRGHLRASGVSSNVKSSSFHNNKLENKNSEVNHPIILLVLVS